MKCPKCQTEMNEFKDNDGVEVDYCYKGCKATWFDKKELAYVTDTETNLPGIYDQENKGVETDYKCPRCENEKLIEIPYLRGSDLLIEVCRDCHGVLLEPKELGAVHDIARQEPIGIRLKRAKDRMKEAGFILLGETKGKK